MQRGSLAAGAVGGASVAAIAGMFWMLAGPGGGATDSTSGFVTGSTDPGAAAQPASFDRSLPFEERILALEQAVSDERYARQLLQDELFILTSELEELTTSRPDGPSAGAAVSSETQAGRTESGRRRTSESGRIARLVDAGFPQGQAEWILQRESQLQMDALQARYDAERSGDPSSWFQSRTTASDSLRNELGDADYERYLAATGRSTSVAVASVLESSPAQRAGLRPGDEIVSYDGKRIFNMSDLTRQTMQGQPGEQVVVDVLRAGVPVQVVVPRGPIGISGGRRFTR